MLDYKIKELKRQIEPRETEIANMKAQIKQMDRELEQYHKSNAQLDLMIGELRARLDAMQREILEQRKKICDSAAVIRRFKSELHECVQYIQSPERLRESLAALHRQHVQRELPRHELDVNVQHEYHRHREYLERSLLALKEQFAGDVSLHRAENMRVMQDNMALIREINKQREDNKALKQAVQAQLATQQRRTMKAAARARKLGSAMRSGSAGGLGGGDDDGEDPTARMDMNREQIAQLRAHIRELEGRVVATNGDGRPASGGMLPPMDGGNA